MRRPPPSTRRGSGLRAVGLIVWIAGAALAEEPAAAKPRGWSSAPSLSWTSGDHRLDLGASSRLRVESWDAFADDAESYSGTRTRVRAQYGWRGRVFLAAEVQDVRLHGLDDDGTGALATYRNANDGDSHVAGTGFRQLYAELRPSETSFVRLGRQELLLGPEVMYPEPDWKYLKNARLGQRLVGSVGWSHAERMTDGATLGWDLGKHHLFGFAGRPVQGVFAVDDAYETLSRVRLTGGSWTVKRGTLMPDSELGLFALAYEDGREVSNGGLPDDVDVWTLGAHCLGVYPLGKGKLDALFWLAAQGGDYDDLDHSAHAWLAELGYQLPALPGKPWLRAGVNAASGDGDPADGDHETFFNLLPTNHLYYGFADQLAFQNLVNPFVQLRLAPHPKLALNAFVHWFRLEDDADLRYAGTGAFDHNAFGYPGAPSRGYQHVGREYDLVATLTPHSAVSLELGLSWLEGGAIYAPSESQNLRFAYALVEVKY
jgi:hypothetical protein